MTYYNVSLALKSGIKHCKFLLNPGSQKVLYATKPCVSRNFLKSLIISHHPIYCVYHGTWSKSNAGYKICSSGLDIVNRGYWHGGSQTSLSRGPVKKSSEILIDSSVTIEELASHAGVETGGSDQGTLLENRFALRLFFESGYKLLQTHSLLCDEIVKLSRDAGEIVDRGTKTILKPEIVELLLLEYGLTAKYLDKVYEISPRPPCTDENVLKYRAPVVTIMGHVDHGKTTLLDALRKTSVAAGEAGGITQHIGAFSVKVPSGPSITFIDTPGHAAFETMRARGAHVTDVVVLVVAADDGVMPQTVESINHANNANVPLIVAINKMDKPKVNLSNVKNQLLSHGVQLEEFGGDVQTVEISALTGLNLNGLTEAIITHAEVADLKAEFDGLAEGVILESRVEKGKGPVATVLVQRGTLKKGSVAVAGVTFGKVRQMLNDNGKVIAIAPPSTPVQVSGWKELPEAGEQLLQVASESFANKVTNYRKTKRQSMKSYGPSLSDCTEDLQVMMKNFDRDYDDSNKLDIVVKGDVNGSVEAILDALKTYKGENPKLSVVSSGVGPVTENDLRMLEPFKGMVFCFNVGVPKDMQKLAMQLDVKIHCGKVIYRLLQTLREEMSAKLPLIREDVSVGEATVLQVFRLTGKRKASIAGCRVKQGQLRKKETYRIYRNKDVVFEGNLSSIKRGNDDIDVAKKETECGLCFINFQNLEEGDRVECFSKKFKKQEVDWKWNF